MCRSPFADSPPSGIPFDRTRQSRVGRSRARTKRRRRRGRRERPPPQENKRPTRPKPSKPPRRRTRKARARPEAPRRSQSRRAARRRVARSKCALRTVFRYGRGLCVSDVCVRTVWVFGPVWFGLDSACNHMSLPLSVPLPLCYFGLSLVFASSSLLSGTCILYCHAKNKHF